MTDRQNVEKVFTSSLLGLRLLMEHVPDQVIQKKCFEKIEEIEQTLARLTKTKIGNGKIFIAFDGKSLIVESTVLVDVILARLNDPVTSESLRRETLTPLLEESFLEFVHDTLAEHLGSGVLSPSEINKKIQ